MPPGQCACSERNFHCGRCTDGSAVPGAFRPGAAAHLPFAMLYGTGSGLLSSRLLVDLNPRTAFVLLCVCGIPASLAAGTLCTFGASALQVSGRLCSAAFGRGGQAPGTGALLGQFSRMLFLLLPLCGAAVGMLYLAGQAKLI